MLNCVHQQDPRVMDIARQMHTLAPQCTYFSSEEMRKVRIKFLEENRDASLEQLLDALDMPFEDHEDIISYFRSLGGAVCNEHAGLLTDDKGRGSWVPRYYHSRYSVGYMIDNGYIS